jgi:replicative DNA helicase
MSDVIKYNANKTKVLDLEKGKIPPNAIDLEEAVLGALMLSGEAVGEVFMLIKNSAVFYKEAHQMIFEAILDLYNKNQEIDLLTTSARLKNHGNLEKVGGDFYLIGLTQKVSSSAHTDFHCRILLQKWMQRELIKISSEVIGKSYDETFDVFDTMSMLSVKLDTINESIVGGGAQLTMADAMDKVVDRVEVLTNLDDSELTGVPTGFKKLDLLTGGWQNSDLIIIAGRPGMGKSALCSALILAACKSNNPVGVISLEMSTVQLVTRLTANNSHFHLNQLFRKGFRDDAPSHHADYFEKLNALKNEMRDYPVYFNDKPSLDVRELKAISRLWKRKHGIKLLIIDYLQLAKDKSKDGYREQEISSISQTLKALAKELDIPVIALSQLSRRVEERGGMKIPQLSDLRESGAIEQDADMISFVWRPGYYKIDVPEDLLAKGGNTGLMIKKHRNGSLDDIALWFDENKTKFCDPDAKFNSNENHFM